ncbi:hypothetical protein EON81_16175 [bacterium]|nr:MAG: hypothetical protein EON81_16175 [bacterium]
MRVQDVLADMLRKTSSDYAFWLGKTAPEGFEWIPGDPDKTKARTLKDQVAECASINRSFTAVFKGDAPSEPPVLADMEEAQAELVASGAAFGDVLATVPDEALEKAFAFPFGELTGLQMAKIAIRNLNYHAGVVNCYQLMLGDDQFHMPPSA